MPRWLNAVLRGAWVTVKALRRTRLLKGKGVDEVISGVDEAVRIIDGDDRPQPSTTPNRPWSPPPPPNIRQPSD